MVIDLLVVFGGDRQFESLAGHGDDALGFCRIAVTGVGKRVDVRVAACISASPNLAADTQRAAGGVARLEGDAAQVDPVLESAAGDNGIGPGG